MRRVLLIAALFQNSLTGLSQELVENKVDEFTKYSIKRTSWETFVTPGMSGTMYFRISRIDDSYFLDFKFMDNTVFSISRDNQMMLKLANEEILKLNPVDYALTCTGCGAIGYMGSNAQGIKTSYSMPSEAVKQILDNKAVKVRVYTSKGYVEKEMKDKFSERLNKALNLVQ